MKPFGLVILGIGMLTILAACSGSKAKNKQSASDAVALTELSDVDTIPLDLEGSLIHWKGFKPSGEHYGSIALESGEVYLKGEDVVGGFAQIDMNSIVVGDLSGDNAEKLKKHLESADFFEAESFPTARFEISKAEKLHADSIRIWGNLTLKGISKNINFDAAAKKLGESYQLESESFSINRVDWGVKYGSKNIFKNLGDKFINDDIELKLKVISTSP